MKNKSNPTILDYLSPSHYKLVELKELSVDLIYLVKKKSRISNIYQTMELPETVLSNPIIGLDCDQFTLAYNDHAAVPSYIQKWVDSLRLLPGSPALILPHTSHMNPILWRMHQPLDFPNNPSEHLARARSIVNTVSKALRCGLANNLDQTLINCAAETFPTDWQEDHYSQLWALRAHYWNNVLKTQYYHCTQSKDKWSSCQAGWVSRRYIVLILPGGENYALLNNDMILMIKDICESYLTSHIFLSLNPKFPILPTDLSFWENWTREVLIACGNSGYQMIKSIESLCKSRIIQLSETILDPDDCWNEMTTKLRDKAIKSLNPSAASSLASQLINWIGGITDINRLSEIFCLLKMAGHPHVNVRGGGRKVRELGTRDLLLPLGTGQELERSFCHLYTRGYINKHKEWPRMKFLRRVDESKTELERLRDRNFQNLPMGLSMYPPADWDTCIFLPHKVFDYGDDFLSLMSDKSLSYYRDEFDFAWREDLDYVPPKPTSHRRVLLETLRTEELDMRKICHMVSTRSIPERWKIVSVNPKEREAKEEPRLYSMMPLPMRSFFVLLEGNLSKGIFPEVAEQTMTESRTGLVQRFHGLSNPGSSVKKVHAELDLESWNLIWRIETAAPAGSRIDQIFGVVALFTYIHQYFRESMINVRVRGFVPDGLNASNRQDPPESDLLWYEHLAGFEGIAQKLWTLLTAAMIHSILWPLGLDYIITGQGDNQVVTIIVRYPVGIVEEGKQTYTRQLVQEVKNRLKSGCRRYGHILKPEECTQSSAYVSYSKEMWCNGVSLSTAIKGVSRLFPTTTSDAPSLTEYIGGLTSGGLASTERSSKSTVGYWITLWRIGYTLSQELDNSLLHKQRLGETIQYSKMTQNQKTAVCMTLSVVPQSLGGMPVPAWSEFLYRGIPDPLASGILWINLISTIPQCRAWRNMVYSGVMFDQNPNAKRLILDPFSLPFSSPTDAKSTTSSTVKGQLVGVTRNKILKEMLLAGNQDSEKVLDDLIAMTPMYPKVAHDLYQLSVPGVVEKFSKRFTNTKTILGVGRMEGVAVTSISLHADLIYHKWILRWFHSLKAYSGTNQPSLRSYLGAEKLRSFWKIKDLRGVSVFHPLDIGFYRSTPVVELDRTPRVVSLMSHNCTDPFNTRGHSPPYLGSSTQVKAAHKGAKLVSTSPPLRDALKILQTSILVMAPGSLAELLAKTIAQSRYSGHIDNLLPFVDPIIGGTLAHRFNLTDAEMGSYLSCQPNVASHISISSNLSTTMGNDDYPAVYQTIFLTLISLHTLVWSTQRQSYPRTIYLEANLSGISPLIDHPVTLAKQVLSYSSPTILGSNYYLVGQTALVHTRSLLSASLSSGELYSTIPIRREGLLIFALRHQFRQRIKSTPTPILYGGTSWAEQSSGRVVDLPEARCIGRSYYEISITNAVLDVMRVTRRRFKGSWQKKEDWVNSVRGTFESILLPLSPSFVSTYNEGYSDYKGCPIENLKGYEGAIRLTSLCLSRLSSELDKVRVVLFQKEPESLLSISQIIINRLILYWSNSISDSNLKGARALAKVSRMIKVIAADEDDIQLRLWRIIPPMVAPSGLLTRSAEYPSVVLRQLRNLPMHLAADIGEGPRTDWRGFKVQHPCLQCRVGGQIGPLSREQFIFNKEELETGWINRSGLSIGSSECLWYPCTALIKQGHRVHIIGAGSGSISRIIPSTCPQRYYDIPEYAELRGHTFVDPPVRLITKVVDLSPLTWSIPGGCDITKQSSLKLICSGVVDNDTVIIDVEGLSTHNRLEAFNIVSSLVPNCLVLVKILDIGSEVRRLIKIICSQGDATTVWWRSPVHMENELVIGGYNMKVNPLNPLNDDPCGNDYWPIDADIVTGKEVHALEREYTKLYGKLVRTRCELARREATRGERRVLVMERLLATDELFHPDRYN